MKASVQAASNGGVAGPDTRQVTRYVRQMDRIPGWFERVDAMLFVALGEAQASREVSGHLLEIGVYYGKSAILLGYLRAPEDDLVVCDLFEDDGEVTDDNRREMQATYSALSRSGFE